MLLSAARPTSLASDQTKEGARSGVQRTSRMGAESERFDLTKIQLASNLTRKQFSKKIREQDGKARGEKSFPPISNILIAPSQALSQRSMVMDLNPNSALVVRRQRGGMRRGRSEPREDV